MAFLRGLFVQRDGSNNGTTPRGARHALGGLIGRSSTGGVQTGVLMDSMAPVVSGTGAMTYSIRAFAAVTQSSVANGPVISANDATLTVATTAAPGSNSRIDSVYAIQRLITADGGSGASNEFEVLVAQGTVSSSPTPPSIPSGALRLANVTVTAGATSTSGLTFARAHEWVAANGGIVPESDGSRLGRVWDGERSAVVGLGQIVAGQSEAIRSATFMQMGVATVTTGPFGDITVSLPQVFPTALLGAVVTDAISIGGGAGAPYVAKYRPDNSTASGLGLRVYQANTGAYVVTSSVRVSYIAWGH